MSCGSIRTARHTRKTIGPCRSTRAANASSASFALAGRKPLQELAVGQLADRPDVKKRAKLPDDSSILANRHLCLAPPVVGRSRHFASSLRPGRLRRRWRGPVPRVALLSFSQKVPSLDRHLLARLEPLFDFDDAIVGHSEGHLTPLERAIRLLDGNVVLIIVTHDRFNGHADHVVVFRNQKIDPGRHARKKTG